MIEISISRELAADHPGFMAGSAECGHQVEVFDDARSGERATPRTSFTPPVPAPSRRPQPSLRRRSDGRPNHDERETQMSR